MYIDVSVKINPLIPVVDLSIDKRRKIIDLIDVLQEMNIVNNNVTFIRSIKLGKVVDINETFKESGITSGDLIEVI